MAGAGLLGEEGSDCEDAEAAMKKHLVLGGDGLGVFEVALHLEVHHGELALVGEQGGKNESIASSGSLFELFDLQLLSLILQNKSDVSAIEGQSLIDCLLD